jgi:hypothetical protein
VLLWLCTIDNERLATCALVSIPSRLLLFLFVVTLFAVAVALLHVAMFPSPTSCDLQCLLLGLMKNSMTNERLLEAAGLTPRRHRKTRVLLGVLTNTDAASRDTAGSPLFDTKELFMGPSPLPDTTVTTPGQLVKSSSTGSVPDAANSFPVCIEPSELASPLRFGGTLATSSFHRGISHSLEERALWGKLGGLDGEASTSGPDDFIVGYDASVVHRLIQFATKQPPSRLVTLQVCSASLCVINLVLWLLTHFRGSCQCFSSSHTDCCLYHFGADNAWV